MNQVKKQQIGELEAAAEVVKLTIQKADKEWPGIYKSLQDMYKDKFVLEDELQAPYDFALAALSLGLESTKNIFTQEQANRLNEYVTYLVTTDEIGEYAKNELEAYCKEFEKKFEETRNYPHDNVGSRLLHRLLGKNIHSFTIKFGEKQTDILDPILIEMLSSTLIMLLAPNPWKIIHDQYEMVDSKVSIEDLKKEAEKLKQ